MLQDKDKTTQIFTITWCSVLLKRLNTPHHPTPHILASLENYLQELQALTMDSRPSLTPSAEEKYLNKKDL